MTKKKNTKSEFKCEISLIGGNYDKKQFGIVYPSPKYLVLGMGLELYERQSPDTVFEATYRYTDNWDNYKKYLEEQAHEN